MARSLTVRHEEDPSTSYLLNVFLALAFGWLVFAAVGSAVGSAGGTPAEQPVPAVLE